MTAINNMGLHSHIYSRLNSDNAVGRRCENSKFTAERLFIVAVSL